MARGYEAISTIAIDAPKAKVWEALTDPAKVLALLSRRCNGAVFVRGDQAHA